MSASPSCSRGTQRHHHSARAVDVGPFAGCFLFLSASNAALGCCASRRVPAGPTHYPLPRLWSTHPPPTPITFELESCRPTFRRRLWSAAAAALPPFPPPPGNAVLHTLVAAARGAPWRYTQPRGRLWWRRRWDGGSSRSGRGHRGQPRKQAVARRLLHRPPARSRPGAAAGHRGPGCVHYDMERGGAEAVDTGDTS